MRDAQSPLDKGDLGGSFRRKPKTKDPYKSARVIQFFHSLKQFWITKSGRFGFLTEPDFEQKLWILQTSL